MGVLNEKRNLIFFRIKISLLLFLDAIFFLGACFLILGLVINFPEFKVALYLIGILLTSLTSFVCLTLFINSLFKNKPKRLFRNIVIIITALMIFFSLGLYYLFEPSEILGGSVANGKYKEGQTVLGERITYLFRDPRIGDIIVFDNGNRSIRVGPIFDIQKEGSKTFYLVKLANSQYSKTTKSDISKKIYIGLPFKESKKEAKNNLTFENYPNSGNVGKMFIDEDFIWITNKEGLTKYDKKTGEKIIFTEKDGLLKNLTNDVFKYKDEVWIANSGTGISVYNLKNKLWRYFWPANGLVNNSNLTMKLDGDTVWLGTFKGFGKYDFKTDKWQNWPKIKIDKLVFDNIANLFFDENFVWVIPAASSLQDFVLQLDKKTLEWHKFIGTYDWGQEKIKEEGGELDKYHIGEMKYGNKYWSFNKDGQIETTDVASGDKEIIATDFLKEYCDNDFEKDFNFDNDIFWFGCQQGFAQYNLTDKTWIFKTTIENYPAEIKEIYDVNDGSLFVDSNLGLGIVKPKEHFWEPIDIKLGHTVSSFDGLWLGDNIYISGKCEVEGCSLGTFLWRYNPQLKQINEINLPKEEADKNLELLNLNLNGNLWFFVSYGDTAIEEFNPLSGKINIFKIKDLYTEYKDSLLINSVEEGDDNTLWISFRNTKPFIGKLDLKLRKLDVIEEPDFFNYVRKFTVLNNEIFTLIQVFIDGKYSNALYKYSPANGLWEEVSIPGLDKVNTVIDNISTFGNYLLVGDNSGMSVYNADDKSWENYTHKDGLLGDSNISFSSDGKELWLRFRSFTNGYTDGISKVDFIK